MKAVRAILQIDSDDKLYEFSGKMSKTLVYTLVKELRLFRGIRGMVTPVHISPLFTLGKREFELGDLVSPLYRYDKKNDNEGVKWVLEPIELGGEYIIHIGGEDGIIDLVHKRISMLSNPLSIKQGDSIVTYSIEKVQEVTKQIKEKIDMPERVRLYLKSPALIFNIFAPGKLPKFTPSAIELLAVPYMFTHNILTYTTSTLVSSSRILGSLVETWYSINSLKPVMVPFKGKKEAALMGSVTYIVEARKSNIKEEIREVIATAEIVGIGESRQNGFGTVVVQTF